MHDDNQPLRAQELRFFATVPRACSYLPDRSAISVFADPDGTFTVVDWKTGTPPDGCSPAK